MRLRSVTFVALALNLVFVAAQSEPAVAQEEQQGSTIRLVSATEPVADETTTATPTEEPALEPAVEDSASSPATDTEEQAATPSAYSDPPPEMPAGLPTVRPIAPPATPTPVEPPIASRARTPAGIYASAKSQATLNRLPGPAPVQPSPRAQTVSRRGKPFQSMQSEPTISPYLNLYRNDGSGNPLSNYVTLVRPQMEQREANRAQLEEIQKLRGQLQNMSSAATAPQQNAGGKMPARYMDTAQFYGGIHR